MKLCLKSGIGSVQQIFPSEDESRELADEDDDEESEVTVLLLVALLKSVGPSISFS